MVGITLSNLTSIEINLFLWDSFQMPWSCSKTYESLMNFLGMEAIWNWWGIKQAAKSICFTNTACTGTPGKHGMKFLVQSCPAHEYDYVSCLWTALYLPHKHSPECEHKHTGWGDAFSEAIKHPCAPAYKLSAKSDSTGNLYGEEVVWINPPLRVRAAWLLHQPGVLSLLKLIY